MRKIAKLGKLPKFLWSGSTKPRKRMSLAAVCNVKCGDGTPLEHMGCYVPRRDLGRSDRSNAVLAEITWLSAGLQHRKIQHFPRITRYGAKPHDSPTTRQLSACQNILQKNASLCFKTVWNTSAACVAQTGLLVVFLVFCPRISPNMSGKSSFIRNKTSPTLSEYRYLVSRWLPDKNYDKQTHTYTRKGGRLAKTAQVCADVCHKPSRNLICVANNLVAQNDRIPCRQKQTAANVQCGSSCEVGFSRPVCCKRSAMIHAQTPTLRKLTDRQTETRGQTEADRERERERERQTDRERGEREREREEKTHTHTHK